MLLVVPGAILGGIVGWFISKPVNWVLGKLLQAFNWLFDRATDIYGKSVGWALRFSAIVLLIYRNRASVDLGQVAEMKG